jgi:polar amino acid transport system permease protein
MSEKQNSAWSPSSREIERRQSRRRFQPQASTYCCGFFYFCTWNLAIILVTSPGWETVKTTFFDVEYGKEVFPTVIKGLGSILQLSFIGGAFIGVIALGTGSDTNYKVTCAYTI